jgi:hypothetical protein
LADDVETLRPVVLAAPLVASATGFARHRLVLYKDIGLNDPPLRQRMTVRIAIQAPSCRLSRSGS